MHFFSFKAHRYKSSTVVDGKVSPTVSFIHNLPSRPHGLFLTQSCIFSRQRPSLIFTFNLIQKYYQFPVTHRISDLGLYHSSLGCVLFNILMRITRL